MFIFNDDTVNEDEKQDEKLFISGTKQELCKVKANPSMSSDLYQTKEMKKKMNTSHFVSVK